MQQDSMRQRMLMRTEITARVAGAKEPRELEEIINEKLRELQESGYQTSGVQVVGDKVLLLGSRLVEPVKSVSSAPLPNTKALQEIEVTYVFIENNETKRLTFSTLLQAIMASDRHIHENSATPLAIHVTSMTSYDINDIMAMRPERTG